MTANCSASPRTRSTRYPSSRPWCCSASIATPKAAGCFAINVLRDTQKQLSNVFAKALADKWSGVPYEIWDTGSPILTDCLASFECQTRATHDGGDHVIFIGEVLRMSRNSAGAPLLYYRGSYCSLAEAAQ